MREPPGNLPLRPVLDMLYLLQRRHQVCVQAKSHIRKQPTAHIYYIYTWEGFMDFYHSEKLGSAAATTLSYRGPGVT